jgi:predicted PurR-regulated permease PerM
MTMAALMLFVILVPVTSAVLTITNHADVIIEQTRRLTSEPLPPPPAWLGDVPVAGDKLTERWRILAADDPADRSDRLASYAKQALQWFAANAGNVGGTILRLVLTVIIAIILYAKGEVVRDGLLRFAKRLAGPQGEEVAVLAAKVVRGVVLGVVLTALIQAAVGGIGIYIAGVPAAALLTAVMLILCLAQLGPVPVLLPAIIWLYWSGQPVWGTVLVVVSVIAVTVDGVVRPILIRKGADLPLLLIFAGVIGGLVAFGIIGLFIGPVILAVSYTLLKAWMSGDTSEEKIRAD